MPQPDSRSPLRALADQRNIRIGTAVSSKALREDPAYAATLTREFNIVTAENAMKFGPLRPARETYAFENADAIVDLAMAHDMAVRGHTLLWHNMIPDWLSEGRFSNDDCVDIIRSHIQTVTRHFRGKVGVWDVVNEAFEENGTWRPSLFRCALGPEYLAMAFHWAREGDPDARLFYNDYAAEEVNVKLTAIYKAARDLLKRGTPLDGIGLQMHVVGKRPPRPQSVAENIRRFRDLGLEVQVTEMDARLPTPASEADLRAQADIYRSIIEICLAEGCTAFVTWGFTDCHSWVPGFFKGEGSALIFDAEYNPKPAYFALREALQAEKRPGTAGNGASGLRRFFSGFRPRH